MRGLALSDRVLLKLAGGPRNVRMLSSELGADTAGLGRVLRALAARGLVEEVVLRERGAWWRIAPGAQVEYEPARVVARPPATFGSRDVLQPPALDASTCQVVTAHGKPCRLRVVKDDRCFLHVPRGTAS